MYTPFHIDSMIESHVLIKKRLKSQDVQVTFNLNSSRKVDPSIEQEALDNWYKNLQTYKENNQKIWDGTTYRLNTLKIYENSLDLELSTVKFSTINGYRDIFKKYDLNTEYYIDHISVGALIKTSDNKYLFGERSGKTAARSPIDLIGGGASKDELEITSGEDFETLLLKEIEEETNLDLNHIKKSEIIGIVRSQSTNVIIIFEVILNISSQNVLRLFKQRGDDEMKSLVFVEQANLKESLGLMGGYRVLLYDLINC